MRKILILGVNGFIGSHLTESISRADRLRDLRHGPRVRPRRALARPPALPLPRRRHLDQPRVDRVPRQEVRRVPAARRDRDAGDVRQGSAARCSSSTSSRTCAIVRQCVKYETRVIFPSTSEVYGMCEDDEFDEETSTLVYGPVTKQRWIYACAKQLHRPRDLRATASADGPRLHALPAVQLDRAGPRLDPHARRKAARAS